jgi:hypothetical protein
VFALKQAQAGTTVAEVIRRMGVSEQTFYVGIRWTAGSVLVSQNQPCRSPSIVHHAEHRDLGCLLALDCGCPESNYTAFPHGALH